MTKDELLAKLEEMHEEASNEWYKVSMATCGEWATTRQSAPLFAKKKTLKEVIELVKQLS